MTPDDLLESYLSITSDREFCEQFLAAVEPSELMQISRLGLVLLAPECFALGVAGELLGRIERAGFCVLDYRIQKLSEDQIARMFIPGWIPERFRWWLIQQRYLMGPTAAVLLTHGDERAVSDALTEAKGYRTPRLARPGTWRHDLGAINGVLNLLHSADTPAQLLRNACPFFTPLRLAAALTKARDRHAIVDSAQRWREARDIGMGGFDVASGRCGAFVDVYLNLLRRLVALQWDATRQKPLVVVDRWLADAIVLVKAKDRRAPEAVARALRELAGCEPLFDVRRGTVVHVLVRLADAPNLAWDRWVEAIGEEGGGLDPWERLILVSTLYYADEELPTVLTEAVQSQM